MAGYMSDNHVKVAILSALSKVTDYLSRKERSSTCWLFGDRISKVAVNFVKQRKSRSLKKRLEIIIGTFFAIFFVLVLEYSQFQHIFIAFKQFEEELTTCMHGGIIENNTSMMSHFTLTGENTPFCPAQH
jgi:hypothetical protein